MSTLTDAIKAQIVTAIGEAYPTHCQSLDEVELRAVEIEGFRKGFQAAASLVAASEARGQEPVLHPDDIAVDLWAADMKRTMKRGRDKGRGGWEDPKQCSIETLARMLVDHIPKGDPMDISALSMMLHTRGRKLMEEHPCCYSEVVRAIRSAAASTNVTDDKLHEALTALLENPAPTPMMPAKKFDAAWEAHKVARDNASALIFGKAASNG